jgi:sorting nexin-29
VPLHKKGDIKKCENYKGISLLNSGYKIYAKIMKNKLYEYYKGNLGEEKNGFRRGCSCSDSYFSIKLIIGKSREFNIITHLAFIDFEKAFDNVNRNTLLDILAIDNVLDQIIHAIYNIYSNNKILIKTDSNPPKWEPINKGL